TAAIGLGVALFAGAAGGEPALVALGLAVAGAAFGFLPWNWQPARIFLGDVGSVPLGYALGWLLLSLAAAGAWAAALILPLYYLADATLTLMRRLARGERVWQAHREHFYQRATQAGRSHAAVVSLVAAAAAAPAPWPLPPFYLADAPLPLMRRLARGERVWQAHREHFYQRATQAGRSHAAVVSLVAVADTVLIALALGSARWPWAMLAA